MVTQPLNLSIENLVSNGSNGFKWFNCLLSNGSILYRYVSGADELAHFFGRADSNDFLVPLFITAGLYKLTLSLKAPGFNPPLYEYMKCDILV